jgi:hypothetical protein
MFRLQTILKHIKEKLKQWNKEVFGNIYQDKKVLEDKMGWLQEQCIQEGYNEERKKEENQLIQEWEARCKQEEILWRQESIVQQLKEGEKDTKFFHKSTISRRNHNKIMKIHDQEGIERESHQDIENSLINHFLNIAREPNLDRTEEIHRILRHISRVVTEEHNLNLRKPISP